MTHAKKLLAILIAMLVPFAVVANANADGETVEDARKAAQNKRLSPIAVEAVYQQFAPRIQDTEKPSKDTRREAQRWLDTDTLIER